MKKLFSSSVGQKLIMSLSGLFLITFILVHLLLNLLLLVGPEAYNKAVHFMATNPLMHLMEPVLAAGFIFHIIYATILTLQNQKARPEAYAVVDQSESSSWSSRNMYVLGGLVLIFILLHLVNFFFKMKFGVGGELPKVVHEGIEMDNAYPLVTGLFKEWWYAVIYVIGAVLLALHLRHSLWSALQTLGMNNSNLRPILEKISILYAVIIGVGFSIIPIYFLIS